MYITNTFHVYNLKVIRYIKNYFCIVGKRFKPEEFNAICLFEKESVEKYLHQRSKNNSSKETSKSTRVNQVEERQV